MKKIILLSLLLILSFPAMAQNMIGIELKKNVNNGYSFKLPVYFDAKAQLPFLPGAYLRTDMTFTAPRGEFTGSMKQLNHSNFRAVVGSGFTLLGWRCEIESGATNWFEGNNEGVPEGIVMDNSARIYLVW